MFFNVSKAHMKLRVFSWNMWASVFPRKCGTQCPIYLNALQFLNIVNLKCTVVYITNTHQILSLRAHNLMNTSKAGCIIHTVHVLGHNSVLQYLVLHTCVNINTNYVPTWDTETMWFSAHNLMSTFKAGYVIITVSFCGAILKPKHKKKLGPQKPCGSARGI